MEISNVGASIYHEIEAIYTRTEQGRLLRIFGANAKPLEIAWGSIWNQLSEQIRLRNGEKSLDDVEISIDSAQYLIWEGYQDENKTLLGVIQRVVPDGQKHPFRNFFLSLLHRKIKLHSTETPQQTDDENDISKIQTRQIVDLFDRRLRHISPNDQWHLGGREYFESRVYHYISRRLPCEFCLPAFPCKSSNQDKVMGTFPDRGEEMGLLKLHSFAREVEQMYPPGAKMWIISDGHVFSDCIGVGDDVVDAYTAKLVEMNNRISLEQNSKDRVGFQSLVDLFDLKNASIPPSALAERLDIPEINHYLETTLENEAELCRRILMSGCQSDRTALRRRIDSGDPAILALYRGFSRFMLEDLELHPATKNMTKSQRKKLSIKVSFEMIMRNQAYSNLVELVFPDHVRLSIHAHNNSGPKFGIQLFDKKLCRPASALLNAPGSDDSADLLHIPTPWHNCVIEVAGDPKIYVGKSKVVKEAINNGLYSGGWQVADEHAGRFEVARTQYIETAKEEVVKVHVAVGKTAKEEVAEVSVAVCQKQETRSTTIGMLPTVIGAWSTRVWRVGYRLGLGLYRWTTSWMISR